MRGRIVTMLGMFVLAGALGCSSGSSNSTITQPGATGSASVTIADFSFSPQNVTITAGGTVNWTNNGPSAHTATSNGTEFDSGNMSSGASFSHTFNTKGTFAYHCAIHSSMTGTVTVQ